MTAPGSRIAPRETVPDEERAHLALFCTLMVTHPEVVGAIIASYESPDDLRAAADRLDSHDDSVYALALARLATSLASGDPTTRVTMDIDLEHQMLLAIETAPAERDPGLIRLGALAASLAINKENATIQQEPWPAIYGGPLAA
ncbi:MAG TPA: hypothetical protein VD735_02120 [Candidatus Saccharimonadales bacterium]|nr:hypothetical protein [Candidatus Saccharimonadales bacterium]